MDKRFKIVIFSLVLLVAVVLLGVLIAHKSSSSALCENAKELYFTGKDGNGSCYEAGSRAECPPRMILRASPKNKSAGLCDCDTESNPRAMVYHEQTNTCYYVLQQAYCAPGHLLVINKRSRQPGCVENSCGSQTSSDGTEIVPLSDGRCVELGKHDSMTCNNSEVIKFFQFKIYPACSINNVHLGNVGSQIARCPWGTVNSPLGGCQPEFDF